MEGNQKMAVLGSGLVVAGIGLGIVGAAFMVPAVIAWTSKLVDKRSGGLSSRLEGASKTLGNVAGNLQRSLNEARKAGVAEWRRGQTGERQVAS